MTVEYPNAHCVLILAGGGGHSMYAKNLARELVKLNLGVDFLVAEGENFEDNYSTLGLVQGAICKPRRPRDDNPFKILWGGIKALFQSFKYVNKNYSAVISCGSNFALAPCLWAKLKGIPIVNIESPVRFRKASKTAKILEAHSAITALHWVEQLEIIKSGIVFGPILPEKPEFNRDGGHLFVTVGTHGYIALIGSALGLADKKVILQTGISARNYKASIPDKWEVYEFLPHETMLQYIREAYCVVTHFGTTALEAYVHKVPVVMVVNQVWKHGATRDDAEKLGEKLGFIVFKYCPSTLELSNAMSRISLIKRPVYKDGTKNLAEAIQELVI